MSSRCLSPGSIYAQTSERDDEWIPGIKPGMTTFSLEQESRHPSRLEAPRMWLRLRRSSATVAVMQQREEVVLPALRRRLDEAGLGHVLGVDHGADWLGLVDGAWLRKEPRYLLDRRALLHEREIGL